MIRLTVVLCALFLSIEALAADPNDPCSERGFDLYLMEKCRQQRAAERERQKKLEDARRQSTIPADPMVQCPDGVFRKRGECSLPTMGPSKSEGATPASQPIDYSGWVTQHAPTIAQFERRTGLPETHADLLAQLQGEAREVFDIVSYMPDGRSAMTLSALAQRAVFIGILHWEAAEQAQLEGLRAQGFKRADEAVITLKTIATDPSMPLRREAAGILFQIKSRFPQEAPVITLRFDLEPYNDHRESFYDLLKYRTEIANELNRLGRRHDSEKSGSAEAQIMQGINLAASDPEKGFLLLEEGLRQRPDFSATAYRALASARTSNARLDKMSRERRSEEWDKATNDYENAVRLEPASIETRLQLVWTYAATMRRDPSLRAKWREHIDAILAIDPGNPSAIQSRADDSFFSGDFAGALRDYEQMASVGKSSANHMEIASYVAGNFRRAADLSRDMDRKGGYGEEMKALYLLADTRAGGYPNTYAYNDSCKWSSRLNESISLCALFVLQTSSPAEIEAAVNLFETKTDVAESWRARKMSESYWWLGEHALVIRKDVPEARRFLTLAAEASESDWHANAAKVELARLDEIKPVPEAGKKKKKRA